MTETGSFAINVYCMLYNYIYIYKFISNTKNVHTYIHTSDPWEKIVLGSCSQKNSGPNKMHCFNLFVFLNVYRCFYFLCKFGPSILKENIGLIDFVDLVDESGYATPLKESVIFKTLQCIERSLYPYYCCGFHPPLPSPGLYRDKMAN